MLENQHSRYGAITRMLPPTLGKVFFVIHADNTSDNHLLEEFPVDRDGVPRVYQTVDAAATDQLAIQAALDACVAGRGDYVIVLPGNGNDYDLGAVLTMSKNDVHLISLEAINPSPNRIGASRSVVLEQTTAAHGVYITGQNCEFAGFYTKPYTGYGFVEGGAAAHCAHVHHNLLYMIGTGIPIDFYTLKGAIYIVIENNFLTSSSGTAPQGIAAGDSCTGAMIVKNIVMVGDGATATIGIHNGAYKGVTEYNTVVGLDGAGADGTVTTCFTTAGGVCNWNIANDHASNDFTNDGTYMDAANWSGGINKAT